MKLTNTRQQSVSKWFNGKAIPEYDHAIQLCKYFNVKFEWFMTGRGDKYMDPVDINTQRNIETKKFIDLLNQLPNDDFRQVTYVGQDLATYLLEKQKEHNGKD